MIFSYKPLSARGDTGFTLVELMVGMALSLFGVLVIYQVLTNTQAYRRSTAGTSAAQQNGAVALYYLERDLRQAGYGVQANNRNRSQPAATLKARVNALYGCTVQASSPTGAFTFALAPFVVTNGPTNNAPDALTVLYGNSPLQSGGVPIAPSQSVTGSGPVWLQSIQGFAVNDIFIVANPPGSCEMSQVAALCVLASPSPDANCSNSTYKFTHTGGNYSRNFTATYGPGTAAGTQAAAYVFNLGQQPALATYSITTDANGQSALSRRDQFDTNASGPITRTIADDIINMKIQVGLADGTYIPYAVGLSWEKVTSLRVAIVARSNLLEKDTVKQATDQGTLHIFPAVMSGGAVVTPAVDMTLSATQQRYRYKIYVTVVPLRNLLWSPA